MDLKEEYMDLKNCGHRSHREKLFIISIVIFCMSAATAFALEPPRPEEIEKLETEGKLKSSLEMVENVDNHKVNPYLVEKLQRKIESLRLKSLGMSDAAINNYLSKATPPLGRQGGIQSTGSPRTFVLLIEFQDYTHSVTSATINDMFWGDGNPADYPLDSLTNWYDRSSHGLLDLSDGATLGWYQTTYNRSDVEQTNSGRENLIKEALNSFDASHDFSVYDNDGNGDIEYFLVMWTGPAGDWATFWWGWNLGWTDGSYTIDGKTLNNYSWQWESDDPSVVIHETGHSMGLPDYYDYDDSVGPDGGVGGFDMMHGTGDHNCFSKWMLDWVTPTVVSGSRQDLTLDDTFNSTDCVLLWPGVSEDDFFSEFFLIENRQDLGNDESLWFAPDGLAVWHVDATLDATGTNFKYDNSYTEHKLLRLMEADGLEEIETGDGSADSGDLYSTSHEFTPISTPSSAKYDDTDSFVSIWDIADAGSTPGDVISASYAANNFSITNDSIGSFATWATVSGVKSLKGDFDGDGRTDVALLRRTSGWGTMPIAFANNDGTWDITNNSIGSFAPWATVSGVEPLIGDFNNDGRTDVALLRQTPGWSTMPIAFANGDGTWDITNNSIGSFANWATAGLGGGEFPAKTVKPLTGDFNNDGRTDIALIRQTPGWGTMPIAFANGDGTWDITNNSIGSFATWATVSGVEPLIGDFNNDGRTDVALLRRTSGWGTMPIAFANGDGTWDITNNSIGSFATWATVSGVEPLIGDFNNDGRTDVALLRRTPGWGTMPIAFANGDGTWDITNNSIGSFANWATVNSTCESPYICFPSATPLTGDFNNDGRTDVALLNQNSGWRTMPIAFANGDGTWDITNNSIGSFANWATVIGVEPLTGDFNNDGRTDVALLNQSLGWGTMPIAFSLWW
ncbi:hypothetical protein KKHLCK_08915 [Candidatus Electrothrix laxa]